MLAASWHLGAEIEGDAAQDQPEQKHEDRNVERRQDDAMRQREGDQQQADGQHQPGFVGVPERADGGDHRVQFSILGCREQNADAEIETVENNVDQDGEAHQAGEDQRKRGWPVEGHLFLLTHQSRLIAM